jgi:hypothetical protein
MVDFIHRKIQNKKAEKITTLFAREIWRLQGILADIIADQDSRFKAKIWKSLIPKLGIRPWMLTAFHSETDGRTKYIN